MKSSSSNGERSWRFLTNHGHVLACVAADPDARLRDIAAAVGITERTAAQIVDDLEEAGYLTRSRIGRRNRYAIHEAMPLRHPQHAHRTVAELLSFLATPSGRAGDGES